MPAQFFDFLLTNEVEAGCKDIMNLPIIGLFIVALFTIDFSVQSLAAPSTLTVSPQIPRRPTDVLRATFGNGISAVRTANTITFTLRNGNRLTMDTSPPSAASPIPRDRCEKLKHWLDTHENPALWRKRCLTFFDSCLRSA